jgi:hypothetical protein
MRHGLDGRCIGPGGDIDGDNDGDAEPDAEAEAEEEEGDQDATPRRPIDVANELNDRRRLAGLTKLLRGEHEGGGDGDEKDALLLQTAVLIRRLLRSDSSQEGSRQHTDAGEDWLSIVIAPSFSLVCS